MKIKLKDLNPNPFKQKINGGKLNQEKIEKLKESIKSDGFWAGIMCRQTDSGYQIPFGHHRVESAKQVLGKDYVVDIPILELSDEQMVRMLANENSMQNEEFAIYQVDTVVMARDFLQSDDSVVSSKKTHKETIGAREIAKFLGEKNWSHDKVQQYLRMHEQLNPIILKNLRNSPNVGGKDTGFTVSHAREIVHLDNNKQKEIYDGVKGKKISYREISEVVADVEKGSNVKEAVEKTLKDRGNKEAIKKILSPFEGQRIVLMCDSLIKSIENNPIKSYPPKGQELLRKMYRQLTEVLTNELEG